MGCTASSDQDLLRLKQQIIENDQKHHEQVNLLRFKVEVLVNMLSVEEKRNELSVNRVETLKWLLHSQGMTEEKLTEIIQKIENAATSGNDENVRNSIERSQILLQQRLLDMQGALNRMREEFDLFKKEIIHGFAYTDGKIIPTLTSEEFIERLYTLTENLSKSDIALLASRFDDGDGLVSVVEFIDFCVSAPELRRTKSAYHALRMSLDLLEINLDHIEPPVAAIIDQDQEGQQTDNNQDPATDELVTHESSHLERATQKLQRMWVFVRVEVEKNFVIFDESHLLIQQNTNAKKGITNDGKSNTQDDSSVDDVDALLNKKFNKSNQDFDAVISVDIFKRVLNEVCGKTSKLLEGLELQGRIIFYRDSASIPPHIREVLAKNPHHYMFTRDNKSNSSNGKLIVSKSLNNIHDKENTNTTNKKKSSNNKTADQDKDEDEQDFDDFETFQTKHKLQAPKLIQADPISSSIQNTSKEFAIIEALSYDDIAFITERFELQDRIHYVEFLQYFNSLAQAEQQRQRLAKIDQTRVSPFRFSQEWQVLRDSSMVRKSLSTTAVAAPPLESKTKTFSAPKKLPPRDKDTAKDADKNKDKKKDEPAVSVKEQEEDESTIVDDAADDKKPKDKDKDGKETEDKDKDKKDVKGAENKPETDVVPPKRSSWFFCCSSSNTDKTPINAPAEIKNKDNLRKRDDKKQHKQQEGSDDELDSLDSRDKRHKNKNKLSDDESEDNAKRDEDFPGGFRPKQQAQTPTIKHKPHVNFQNSDSNDDFDERLLRRDGLGVTDKNAPTAAASAANSRFRKRVDGHANNIPTNLDDSMNTPITMNRGDVNVKNNNRYNTNTKTNSNANKSKLDESDEDMDVQYKVKGGNKKSNSKFNDQDEDDDEIEDIGSNIRFQTKRAGGRR